ncbi:hypothetical protein N9A87_02665 [Euryarchaeota archaeon]|nr:hypothetical protein [Euryarchaeota archaeon]
MTGCFGGLVGDAEADDDESDKDEPQWINDVGTSPINWNLSLNQNQWLEVKSSVGLLVIGENSSEEEITQYGLAVSEQTGWSVSVGFSPIFGGDYSICGMLIDGNCYSNDPDGDWYISDWSIIYRIHSV